MTYEKTNGIYYTPPELADFAANLAINSSTQSILDPSYGEGALLLAARKRLLELRSRSPECQLFGFDISPAKTAILDAFKKRILLRTNLREQDFFSIDGEDLTRKYDVIIVNPPYVRHHLISKKILRELRKAHSYLAEIPLTSDYYAYFLLHSMRYLRPGSSLVAILPWSFLYADFAATLRQKLTNNFGSFKLMVIGERLFHDIEERVLILLCENYGEKTKNISLNYYSAIPSKLRKWRQINPATWENTISGNLFTADNAELISKAITDYNFSILAQYAKIRIGSVTGANSFFILKKEFANNVNLSKIKLKPILRHSNALQNLSISSRATQDLLLAIPKNASLPKKVMAYIKNGEDDAINKRHHLKNRHPWYSIPPQSPPDAFLHYMTKEVPFIVRNPDRLLSTNTIHNVDFLPGVDIDTIKWIQFSMLTSISQLSIERIGRTYGGGVLKIEPSAAKKILVYPGQGKPFPKSIEKHINILLGEGDFRQAIKYADERIETLLSIPSKYLKKCHSSYQRLRDIRLGPARRNS